MTRWHWSCGIGVLAALWLAWIVHWAAKQRVNVPDPAVASSNLTFDYRPGDRLAPLEGVELSAATCTIVLFVDPSCQYCLDSMSFYRVLSEQAAAAPRVLQLVAVGIEPQPVLDRFFKRHSVAPTRVVTAKRHQVKARETPTILLVDASGTINRAWIGEVPSATQALILDSIRHVQQ